jgi:hypothetical protein
MRLNFLKIFWKTTYGAISHNIDWLPEARAAILAMVMKWLVYMTEERWTLWGIPVVGYTALRASR